MNDSKLDLVLHGVLSDRVTEAPLILRPWADFQDWGFEKQQVVSRPRLGGRGRRVQFGKNCLTLEF